MLETAAISCHAALSCGEGSRFLHFDYFKIRVVTEMTGLWNCVKRNIYVNVKTLGQSHGSVIAIITFMEAYQPLG